MVCDIDVTKVQSEHGRQSSKPEEFNGGHVKVVRCGEMSKVVGFATKIYKVMLAVKAAITA